MISDNQSWQQPLWQVDWSSLSGTHISYNVWDQNPYLSKFLIIDSTSGVQDSYACSKI